MTELTTADNLFEADYNVAGAFLFDPILLIDVGMPSLSQTERNLNPTLFDVIIQTKVECTFS